MDKKIKIVKRGSPSKYEPSFKRKVILEWYSGVLSSGELSRKYNLGHSAIARWEEWYKQDQEQMLPSTAMELSEKEPEFAGADLPLPKPKEGLEEELRLAKLKIICLETMIDVAEQTLQIEIRKKPGTKSSRK